MKILCFFPIERPVESRLIFTGGEMRFIEVCKRWVQLGHEVHVVGSEYACRLFEEYGFKPLAYAYKPSFSAPMIRHYTSIKRALSKVPAKDFDFIYTHETFICTVTSVLMKKKLRVPLVIGFNLLCPYETSVLSSLIGTYRFCETRFVPLRLGRSLGLAFQTYLRNLLSRKIDLIFAVSKVTKGLLEKMGVNNERIYVVGPGLDFEYVQNINPENKRYDACFLGLIQPRKGVFDLITLWREVLKRKPDAKLLIMGGGQKLSIEKMKSLIQKYDLHDNIKMTGFVSEEEKFKLMKQSKIFIFPSYHEGFAQVICEAMACKLPVVAYDLPGYKEWYGNDVTYVKKRDMNSLLNATLTLLEDDTLRREMGEKALKRVKQYDWNKLAKKEIDIITQKLFNS